MIDICRSRRARTFQIACGRRQLPIHCDSKQRSDEQAEVTRQACRDQNRKNAKSQSDHFFAFSPARPSGGCFGASGNIAYRAIRRQLCILPTRTGCSQASSNLSDVQKEIVEPRIVRDAVAIA
jgi:hypothetical protein